MVPISAVIKASGMLHIIGKTKNPARASSGPAAPTVSSMPNGPPDT
ncbi:hypothetical protein TIFTF001_049346 [Ficus carica]|uniref:Uncharacterized protein n=1 Tax=Ficus carica TaxID=3494 RepID=A0AA87Z057_FICCA|nr:hypothetical protein TIFTF001_049327 [Ficus carica]GMN27142.1 hypothetical protein TIFTF001_049346 [Ficus carica]